MIESRDSWKEVYDRWPVACVDFMVFESVEMRNPGFLLEDARHGYIQYISLSECYFAGKGAALVLPPNERARPSRRVSAAGCDIQQHLQSMFYLLRPEETLKMAVKLESVHPGRTRYLVVVSCTGRQDAEESCLLGIDCHTRATVGLVLRVLADTAITLDGDGGFSVSVCGSQHIFKPVSVQAMWSALQTLHKVSSKAREQNYFLGGLSHDWVSYYEQRIESDRSCLNEWHAMDNLESRRPPSPDSVRTKPRERDETERVIRSTLKEIMMSVDLDEVTSKYIRGRLEEDLDMDLGEFKPFIDQEMLTILGQMDAPTEIFDHVYLGSEWNASNLEELQKNGVRHILNVTREIDNFFPGMFTYLNVRVYDDEKTDLLKHWDDTFKYITKAKKEGSKVLVHCKMGVSRSASVVIAYAMKAYNWDFSQAWKHVKEKRNCIKPNNSFLLQLETYQGILDAMKNKEKLQRSKSDTNLKSPTSPKDGGSLKKEEKSGNRGDDDEEDGLRGAEFSGSELKKTGQRPKSWSPNVKISETMLPSVPLSQSLESIDKAGGGSAEVTREERFDAVRQRAIVQRVAEQDRPPAGAPPTAPTPGPGQGRGGSGEEREESGERARVGDAAPKRAEKKRARVEFNESVRVGEQQTILAEFGSGRASQNYSRIPPYRFVERERIRGPAKFILLAFVFVFLFGVVIVVIIGSFEQRRRKAKFVGSSSRLEKENGRESRKQRRVSSLDSVR